MSLNLLNTYTTEEFDSVEDALADLEAYLETVSEDVKVVDIGVSTFLKDRERAAAWVILEGFSVLSGAHILSDGAVVLTQDHSLAMANGAHVHAAGAVVLTQEHELAVADGAHVNAGGAIVLTQEHDLVVADAYNVDASENLTITTGP